MQDSQLLCAVYSRLTCYNEHCNAHCIPKQQQQHRHPSLHVTVHPSPVQQTLSIAYRTIRRDIDCLGA